MKSVLFTLFTLWTALLKTYYDPAHGMNYAALKTHDAATLENLRQSLGRVNAETLEPKERLAYWINVYNINTVAAIVESYPVKSIRDLSTDPLIFTVFKKPRVPYGNDKLSLDDIENEKIREAFHDPRIHFAINCAAKSCPPLRMEAYSGATLDAQMDDQARKFLTATTGFTRDGDKLVVHVTKIMDWFGADFGDKTAFLRKYLPADKQKLIDAANGKIELAYDDYDWALNDRR